jgi:hypothetical protein
MASTAAAGSWLQVDLGRNFYISGVSTQGRSGSIRTYCSIMVFASHFVSGFVHQVLVSG